MSRSRAFSFVLGIGAGRGSAGGRRLFDNEILNLDNWLLIEVIHDARQIDVIRPRIECFS
jgi:hypothetical protein